MSDETGPSSPVPPPPAHGHGPGAGGQGAGGSRGGSSQPFRALLVVVIGVAVAVLVLARTNNSPASVSASHNNTTVSAPLTTTTTSPAATTTTTVPTTTTSTTLAPSSVTVLVLNGWTTYHAALYFQHQLAAKGYDTRAPNNALSSTNHSSQVFYTSPAYRANALAIAAALSLPSTAVVAPTAANDAAVPAADLSGADIILLVGGDISGRVPVGYNG